ncbi:MAG: amino acid adenylation domain-containing protein [Marinosulfonomonas sp.]
MAEDAEIDGIEDFFPASPQQAGMLFESINRPKSGVNLGLVTAKLNYGANIKKFKAAFESIVQKHQSLRSQIMWENLSAPIQVVRNKVVLNWEHLDWRGVDEIETRLPSLLDELRVEGLNLAAAPAMRLLIVLFDEGSFFIWITHHAFVDDWSVDVVMHETAKAYAGRPETAEPMPYRDFADWLSGRDCKANDAYWKKVLSDIPELTRIQLPFPDAPPKKTKANFARSVELTRDETALLNDVARQLRVTLGAVLSVAWGVVLHRIAVSNDVFFGLAVTQRPSELDGIEAAVGNFVATLPVRFKFDLNRTLRATILGRHDQAIADQAHDSPSLSDLSWGEGSPAERALFESILAINEAGKPQPDSETLFQNWDVQNFSSFPMAIVINPGERLSLKSIADPQRFSVSVVSKLLEMLHAALTALPEHLDRPAVQLPIMRAATLRQAQKGDIGPRLPGTLSLLPSKIDALAKLADKKIAVHDETGGTSYKALIKLSNSIAAGLKEAGVRQDDRIAVFLPRGADAIATYLAAWKLGASYVPMDPDHASARLTEMTKTLGPAALIGTAANVAIIPKGTWSQLSIENLRDNYSLDDRVSAVETEPGDTAYIMFTSGSTGRPKGVEITHQNLAASTLARPIWYKEDPEKYLVVSPFSFDSSVAGIYWTLATGGTLVVPTTKTVKDAQLLAETIDYQSVKTMLCLPSLYDILLDIGGPESLKSLRCVILAGEPVPKHIVSKHYAKCPNAKLINEYGPTEATVWCAAAELSPDDSTVTIGRAIPGTRLFLRDQFGRPVPDGVPGELMVAGSGLARGYLHDIAETEKSFVIGADTNNERAYRTGDLVRRRQDGDFEYLGRADHQVKIRGHRIELSEVDAALSRHEGVLETAVVPITRNGRTSLVAYFVGTVSQDTLISIVSQNLPEPMRPAYFVKVDALPRTSSDKVDRKSLIASGIPENVGRGEAAASETEQVVAELWRKCLGLQEIPDVMTSFFALGGDSLMIMRLAGTISEEFGKQITVAEFMRCASSVRDMAAFVDAATVGSDQFFSQRLSPQEPVLANGDQTALWFAAKTHSIEPFFNLAKGAVVHKALTEKDIRAAAQELMRRHSVLSRRFVLIDRQLWLAHSDEDCPGVECHDVSVPLDEWATSVTQIPFNMDSGLLWRIALRPIGANLCAFVVVIHHSIADGWSLDILMEEFVEQLLNSSKLHAPESPSYLDYLFADAEIRQSKDWGSDIEFWDKTLSDYPSAPSQLPRDRPIPGKTQCFGHTVRKSLSYDASMSLRQVASEAKTTVFSALWVGLAAFIAQETEQADTLIAVSHANRPSSDFDNVVGCFTKALPYRLNLSNNPDFRTATRIAGQLSREYMVHQEIPIEHLPNLSASRPGQYLTSFAQVALQYHDFDWAAKVETSPGLVRTLEFEAGVTAFFEISIEWYWRSGTLVCAMVGRADRYEQSSLEMWLNQYLSTLENFAKSPESAIKSVTKWLS